MPLRRRAPLALALVSLGLVGCSADPGHDVDLTHQSQPFRTGWRGEGHAEITAVRPFRGSTSPNGSYDNHRAASGNGPPGSFGLSAESRAHWRRPSE